MTTIKLFSRKAGELPLAPCVPGTLQQYSLPGFAPMSSVHDGISVLFQQYIDQGYIFRVTHIVSTQEDEYTILSEPGIYLLYCLHRSLHLNLNGLNHIVFHDHAFNLLNLPVYSAVFELKPGTTLKFITVRLFTPFLDNFTARYNSLTGFLHQEKLKKASRFHAVNQVVNMSMIKTMDDLQLAGERNRLNNIYMESKAKELIKQSIELLTKHPVKRTTRLAQPELDKIYKAKEIITSNIKRYFTPMELGGMIDLTIYKISKGFREIYDMSVSEFSLEERIKRAKSLLENTDLTVEQVAEQTGYANRNSLNVALQKSTGYTAHAYRMQCSAA